MALFDIVQSATGYETLLNTVTATLPAPPTVGNTLVLAHLVRDSASIPGAPSGWTAHPSGTIQAGGMFYRVVQGGDSATITAGIIGGPNGRHRLDVVEIAGVLALGASIESSGTATPVAVTLTPTAAVSTIIVAAFYIRSRDSGARVVTPDANSTELFDTTVDTSFAPVLWLGYRKVPTPSGAYTVGGTYSETGRAYGAQAISFVSAGGDPPVASFTGTPTSGDAPLSVTFDDDSAGTPTSWAWDFGDGDTSTSQNPTHIYTDPGVYTVELTATNAAGSDSMTRTSYITVLPTTPGAVLLDVFDMTSGAAVYEGTITDASAKSFQAQDNGVGVVGFKLNRNSPNAGLVVADRLLKIRIPQIHSDYIFAGFLDAPTATVISTDEQGGEELNVTGRGALAYWANAVWLSSNFVEDWWTCTDDPPSNAKGQLNVKANSGPQAGGKYRVYTVAGGVITGYSDETVGSDACWYFRARQTYQWPSENTDRFLVLLLTGPHTGSYFHPHQDGVTELLKTITIGDTIDLGSLGGSAPGAVIRYMLDAAHASDRPINPLPLMTADFTDALDSDGNAWDTTDALAGITVDVHESYLETIGKLLATGVIDVEMGPDLDMHAYNAPHGRDLAGASFGAGVVRFVKGVNIADKLDRQARDAQVATFSEVAGTDDVYVDVALPSPGGRVPREVGIRGDTNDETALEALGLADLNARLDHAEAIGFNVTLPRLDVSPDESIGLYLPGPRYSDNGSYWVGDTIRLHTGTDPHDFDEADAVVAAITLFEDDGGNLRCTVELGTGLGPRQRGRYGSGLASSPGSTGASGSFVSRSSGGSGTVESGDLNSHVEDTAAAHPASAVSIADAGALLAATDVEAALQEIATDVAAALSNPMTTAADLIVGGTSGTPTRLAKGADGQVLTVDPTTHLLVWANSASGFTNPMTTKGDLIVGDTGGAAIRKAVGTDTHVLTADSTATGGVKWAAASASAAPTTAKYVTTLADATLSAEIVRPQLGNYFAATPPISPDATYDDEFDDTSGMSGSGNGLNARWNWRNQGASTATFGKQGWLTLAIPSSASSGWRILEIAAVANGTYDARISAESTANDAGTGMILVDAVNGDLYAYAVFRLSTGLALLVQRWTSVSVFSAGIVATYGIGAQNEIILRIVKSGTALEFWYSGGDGAGFVRFGTVTSTVGETRIGFGAYETGSSGLTKLHVDYFRKVA